VQRNNRVGGVAEVPFGGMQLSRAPQNGSSPSDAAGPVPRVAGARATLFTFSTV